MNRYICFYFVFFLLLSCKESADKRSVISLNGSWEITSTRSISEKPVAFHGKVPVPGLVDMADVPMNHNYGLVYRGSRTAQVYNANDAADIYWESPLSSVEDDSLGIFNRTIYWYRKTFTIDDKDADKDVFQLKINKARYHTWVYVNKQFAGSNVYCFTPTILDIKPFVNTGGEENELIIGVGCVNNLPDSVVNGYDFEKIKYIPGIYDDVKLTISDFPYIENIQTAPDINKGEVRIVAELVTDGHNGPADVTYVVRETATKKTVARGTIKHNTTAGEEITKVDFRVPLSDFRLWSPETPFLYDLELSTPGDDAQTRFGMRSFEASPDSGVVLLNGRPYYMRGTNVCIYRFFEDEQRGNLPWDDRWVIRFHETFKDMHWNSARYCIGFPPDRWYEIADSLGILIQDEYPLWTLGHPKDKNLMLGLTAVGLALEYEQWMRQRWNHACVVIWDAQNETTFPEVAKAIQKVRGLDLSNRPWDNGWDAPASKTDVMEAHPYFFNKYRRPGYTITDNVLKDNLSLPRSPGGGPNERSPAPDGKPYTNPAIINEYGWLWLTRDGSPAAGSDNLYPMFFPEADTPEKRFEVYAKVVAMKTEYWRAHRKAAGVMFLGSLLFSRHETDITHTADMWKDVAKLEYYPYFYEYVKPAFSPVGLMVDFWDNKLQPGTGLDIKINLINDTYDPWTGSVKLSLISEDQPVDLHSIHTELIPLGKEVLTLPVTLPEKQGAYKLIAEIDYKGESVKSIREFMIE